MKLELDVRVRDRQTDRQTDRQLTTKQTVRHIDKGKHRYVHALAYTHTGGERTHTLKHTN